MLDAEPVTIERLERALAVISYVIVQEGAAGAVYGPYLARLEKEIDVLKARVYCFPRSRARSGALSFLHSNGFMQRLRVRKTQRSPRL